MTWLAGDRLFRVLGTLLISILAARTMGPADFGGISYAQTLISFLTIVVALGLGGVVVKGIVNRPAEAGLTLGTACLMQFVVSMTALLTIAIFAGVSGEAANRYDILVLIMAVGLLFRPTDTIRYWFESQVQAKYTVMADNAAFALGAAAKLFSLFYWRSIEAFAWATVAEQLFAALCLIIAYRVSAAKPGPWSGRPSLAMKLLGEAWPLLLSGAAIALYMRIDQIVIMHLQGPAETGIYSAAVRLSEIFYVLPTIVATTFFPRFQRLLNESREGYISAMKRMMAGMTAVCASISIVIFLFARPGVNLIYGLSYDAAVPVLAVHIWTSVFVCLGVLGNQWYLSHGLQGRILLFTALGAVSNLAVNLMLVPMWGAVGAAVASLCAQIISCFLADALSIKTREVFFLKLAALLWPIKAGLRLAKRVVE